MNYKIVSPLLVLILFGVIACAQEKNSIKNVQLFSRVQMPGNIPVNDKGEALMGPETIYTVVVESTGRPVQWDTAYTKSKVYAITPSLITRLPYDAGVNDATGKRMLLTPAKGNQLWLLDLSPLETNQSPKNTTESDNVMVLRGKMNNKKFSRSIQQPIAIRTLPVY